MDVMGVAKRWVASALISARVRGFPVVSALLSMCRSHISTRSAPKEKEEAMATACAPPTFLTSTQHAKTRPGAVRVADRRRRAVPNRTDQIRREPLLDSAYTYTLSGMSRAERGRAPTCTMSALSSPSPPPPSISTSTLPIVSLLLLSALSTLSAAERGTLYRLKVRSSTRPSFVPTTYPALSSSAALPFLTSLPPASSPSSPGRAEALDAVCGTTAKEETKL
mmetsp:Transcript_50685/g.130717  ORF Transcript_50685/g.130717 Transcript_50685/m.130717 type:complete len:223 (-) Transcript_50685:649-1317(-)